MRFILAIFLTTLITGVSAQPLQQFLFTHLGTREGLASDETMGIQQDKKGYIWIATLDGLQRYDGKRLMTFRSSASNKQSIPNDMIRQLELDRKNRLWLSCSENRVGYFNVSDFTFHEAKVRFPQDLLEKAESRLTTDNFGNIMLIITGYTILTYNEKAGEFAEQYNPFQLPKGWKANWVTQDQLHDNYWIACDSGLVKFNPKKSTLSYRGHNQDNDDIINAFAHLGWVTSPYLDRSGRFWILSWPVKEQSFFYSYNIATKKTTEWESRINREMGNAIYYILAVKEQKDSSIWVIGGNLFAKLNKSADLFDIIKNNLPGEFSIRYDAIRQLYEDREHNIWVSTNNGLYRFNPSAQFFHVIPNKRSSGDSIYTSDVTDIQQLKNGNVLVSTWGNGIFPYDKNFNPVNAGFINQSLQLGESLTWCILQRRNGDIWRGNQYGTIFISYANTEQSVKIQPAVFGGRNIRQIAEDKNGDLWLVTNNGDLVKWMAASDSFILVKSLNTVTERLYTDTKGWIWVCTRSGLFKIDCTNGTIAENYTSDGPEGRRLMRSYALDIISYNDSIYIIASGGFNILNINTNKISYLVHGNDFPVNNVSNIIKDRMGKIWATTLSGICNVNIEGRMTITYDQRDGVHTNFFNGASTSMLNDGRIAIGTSHDLLVFDPAEIHNIGMALPDITITGFQLMNNPLLIDSLNKLKNIELQYDKNSVSFEFSTLTYQNNFGISYMLEGLDKTWRNDYGTNQAIYTFLPPGNYTFKLKVENGDKLGSTSFATMKIKIKAPFWKTWWFLSLLAFAAIGIIYWLDKFRVARIRETERVRTRIATSLTKDMSSTLSNINMLSELAKVKLDKDLERTREYIGQISDNSNRMMEVMDDIIWSINPENDELQYTIARMKKYAAFIQSKYDIEICFTVDKKVTDLKLQMDRRHELFLIFKEALLNTGKNADSKFAEVDLKLDKGKLKMTITDNGKGFNAEVNSFGRGLNEMRKKAAALKALLTIRSGESSGTEVVLEMDL